jgi:hypothetical protein
VPRALSANAATPALVGVKFEEPLISWKVVDGGWPAELGEVVAWYYDVAMAADLKYDKDEKNLARKPGIDLAPLECPSTCEVRRLIKASKSEREREREKL